MINRVTENKQINTIIQNLSILFTIAFTTIFYYFFGSLGVKLYAVFVFGVFLYNSFKYFFKITPNP